MFVVPKSIHDGDGQEEDTGAIAQGATVGGVVMTGTAPITIPAPQGSAKVCSIR